MHVLYGRPFKRAFNFLPFFFLSFSLFLVAGGSSGELNYSGPPTRKASSLPLSCTPRPRTFQFCALHITTKLLQESSAAAITAAKAEFPGLPENKPARGWLLLSSKRDVSEPLPTTPVSNVHHRGCELPVQQPVRVARATARQWLGFLSRGPKQAGRESGFGSPAAPRRSRLAGLRTGGGVCSAFPPIGKVQATVEAGLTENGENHTPVLA